MKTPRPGSPWHVYAADFAAFYLGALACYLCRAYFGWSPILAASALDFAVTFVRLPARSDKKGVQIAFCTGTFLGMSSPQILSNHRHVLFASVLGSLLYVFAKPHFKGVGGKMGAVAFLASSVWLILRVFAWAP